MNATVDDARMLAAQAARFTVADLFRRSARLYGERLAVVSSEVELTYERLDDRTNRLAHVLAGEGLARADRLAVLSTMRPECIEADLAAAKLGVTVVALNGHMPADELARCLELARPHLLLASPERGALVDAARAHGAALSKVLWLPDRVGDGASDYERLLAAASDAEPEDAADPEDIHCILFTGGTTGPPKGAMISERAAVIRAFRLADWFGLTSEDGMVGWVPMSHAGGEECVTATFLSGGKVATFEHSEPEAMFAAIERHRLTWAALLPGVITDFLHHPRRAHHDLSSFRFALGHANLMPGVVQGFTAATGAGFWDTFGQTETGFVVASALVEPGTAPSLRKRPTPLLEIRIVDDRMQEVPVGVPGECLVRGPSVMSGYLDDAPATADAFRGGWLHTGDVLICNADGTYTYVDRLDTSPGRDEVPVRR